MITLNLKHYYPWYTWDILVEVPEEVKHAMDEYRRVEQNYKRRAHYNKAQFSLDATDGIEAHAITLYSNAPEELTETMERLCQLCMALNSLPEQQGKRVEAHFLLGLSVKQIAQMEGVSVSAVGKSLDRGLRALKRIF